ncbi:MAG: prepilin-type N-terminal cleavage/methylation domain-containing protein [Acidimicrobiia bacterium]|nr:prepilin-type N-terminal cleavage/methylation domain-containing protein [Acidimicrobiia bacterium]
MKRIRERLSSDEGFTLIELMVVVLIIAILIAIAIPSFIGFRKNAQDRSAQSDLRSGLLAQKGYWTENSQVYTADMTALRTFEPNLTTMDMEIAGAGVDTAVCMEVTSESGTVFAVKESAQGTEYGNGGTASTLPCRDATNPGTAAGTWGSGW